MTEQSTRIEQTQSMLARHHRDGEHFAQLMKESFAGRFDESFWSAWGAWMEPAYSDNPVVLDLGAGPGLFLQALAERTPGIRALGVECAPYMLEAAGELPPGCELIVEDLHAPRLPLAAGEVDAVMASVVLHEMNQPVLALREVHRCLKPGGRIYIADWVRAPLEVYLRAQLESDARVFDGSMDVEALDDTFVHFIEHNRFSREDLIYLLNRCGFAVLHSELLREGRYARIVAERI